MDFIINLYIIILNNLRYFKIPFLYEMSDIMFKDYKKYLSTSLKVYLFVLVIIFILKIVGLDYFGIDISNPIITRVASKFENPYVKDALYLLLLVVYQYLMMSIIFKEDSFKLKKYVFILIPFTYGIQLLKGILVNYGQFYFIVEILYLYLVCIIYQLVVLKLKINKTFNIRFIITIILNWLFEFISMITRYKYSIYVENIIAVLLLDLDYILLLLITQKIVIEKGDVNRCTFLQEVGSSSQKKINLKKSLQRLQKNLQDSITQFKKKSTEEKLSIIIFSVLSLIWNTLTVVLVLLIAFINDTAIECIFILSSFWLSKTSFGKPFHFDSMIICFIVSNLTYYILNRITAPLGISIIIPILLGVGLSYVTSKFVKKPYKPLYRGMPLDLFEDTILQVTEKDSEKYNICYEFYINKKSDVSLSYKYKYSVPGIRKIRDRINNKIKRLWKKSFFIY